jgi:lipid-binding SYLF domain-containing protein
MKRSNKMILALCPLLIAAAACSSASKQSQSDSAMQKHSDSASKQISAATAVVQKMEADPQIQPLLQSSRGIFVIPRYGRGAFLLGAQGGEGVLLVKNGNNWSDPAFYNVGGLSIGLQAGAEAGAMAFILNNDRAVQQFVSQNNFSVNANAGLTVVNYSKAAQAELSRADLIAWSDSKGLFGGAAIGLQDVRFDKDDTSGFYNRQDIALDDVINGRIQAPEGKADPLKQVLTASPTMSGSSTKTPEAPATQSKPVDGKQFNQ